MAKKWQKSPQHLIDNFYALMEFFPEADLRKMFGYPCAFLNGNMFIGLHEANLVIRLPNEDRKQLFEEKLATPFEPMKGRIMREYACFTDPDMNTEKLKKLIQVSIDFVKMLPKKEKKPRKK